jgi:hypothetical protein
MDSTTVASKIFDKSDSAAAGYIYFMPLANIPSVPTDSTIYSGYVKYANNAATPIKNAPMVIRNFGDTIIASTTTDNQGHYAFSKVLSRGYKMTISPSDPWGGVNSTDALVTLNHFTQVLPLTGIKLRAGDVNLSNTVNATDALFEMKRYTGMITSFPSGDYFTKTDTVVINGRQANCNYQMILYGDVNASFAPLSKSTQGVVELVNEGLIMVPSLTDFDLPVKVQAGMVTGAISIGFHYPQEYFEIHGATLASVASDFSWTAANGLFRMAWCCQLPMILPGNAIIVTLHMRSKDLSTLTAPVAIKLYETSEFADGQANAIEGVVLTVPEISAMLSNGGVSPLPLEIKVSKGNGVIISIQNPFTVSAGIILVDMAGKMVAEKSERGLHPGKNSIALDYGSLPPGMYLVRVTLEMNGQILPRVFKVIL